MTPQARALLAIAHEIAASDERVQHVSVRSFGPIAGTSIHFLFVLASGSKDIDLTFTDTDVDGLLAEGEDRLRRVVIERLAREGVIPTVPEDPKSGPARLAALDRSLGREAGFEDVHVAGLGVLDRHPSVGSAGMAAGDEDKVVVLAQFQRAHPFHRAVWLQVATILDVVSTWLTETQRHVGTDAPMETLVDGLRESADSQLVSPLLDFHLSHLFQES